MLRLTDWSHYSQNFNCLPSISTLVKHGGIRSNGNNDTVSEVKLYKKVETKAEEFADVLSLADGIHQKLGDTKWATKIYKEAESKPDADCDDFISHAGYIRDELGNEEWANQILKKTEDKVESFNDLERLAEIIGFNEFDSDKPKTEWAEKVCKVAEENAEDISAYQSLAEWIRNTLGKEKWAELLDQKAKELEDDE